jgi:DNA (cytosine-5)-methyltransferase 1
LDKPKLLDTFCCAGGCSEGYRRAGFEPYGIDIAFQKHYLFPFLQMDALQALDALIKGEGLTFSNGEILYLKDFAAIHASPPCQHGSVVTKCHPGLSEKYPNLIPNTRIRLIQSGKLFIIENVRGMHKFLLNPVMLCGTMFGLKIKRHRYFETSFEINTLYTSCACRGKGAYTASSLDRNGVHHFSSFRNGAKLISITGHNFSVPDARIAMGIGWMNQSELAQAIPPAYTEFIGKHLMAHIDSQNRSK